MNLTCDHLLSLLDTMLLCREGDRREGILLRQGKGWFQVSAGGHEALAVLPMALREDDLIFPYYRDRAIVQGRGTTTDEMALAYFAKRDSSSGGRQMPCHFSDRKRGIYSVSTPTGSQCLPAVGAAWSFKLAGSDRVAVATIGDASTRQGEYYEAVALALQERLPIIFVIEDNRFGISTPTEHQFPYRIGALSDTSLVRVDGRDPVALHEAMTDAVAKARTGEGPTVLWCELDRLCSHTSSDDQRLYRTAEALAADQARDPITRLAECLIARGALSPIEWEARQAAAVAQVEEAYRAAEGAADPEPESLSQLLGAPPALPEPPAAFAEPTTMLTAVNAALRGALEHDRRTVLFGEDIEDPKGGVFGLTKGLSRDFPGRVFNAPLAEATIAGVAGGLAAAGHRPIVEFQFVDFVGPAYNQLIAQLGNLRWRSRGAWTCPAILYAPCGAYLPSGGMWHSQSGEGMLAHVPGMRIAMPSTPQETLRAFWSALHLDDPTFLLLPKHLFHARVPALPWETPQVGRGRRVREGEQVTVVAWGNTVEVACEAADRAAVSADILDLTWLIPWDRALVVESLARTGRLVIVQEDTATGSIGASILAQLVSEPGDFYQLRATPRLVARPDTPMPYAASLERALLPDVDRLTRILKEVVVE